MNPALTVGATVTIGTTIQPASCINECNITSQANYADPHKLIPYVPPKNYCCCMIIKATTVTYFWDIWYAI